ncbi:hypothetical protein ID875_00585 [Streptomyces globisporus]|uniref:Uncharacterized protein n=1 Tax=Streptomyces globisporus TaxID=1908 RepID=A0A927GLH4_STRGL|nr:hypothetical protein [Streptomyces globisporus]
MGDVRRLRHQHRVRPGRGAGRRRGRLLDLQQLLQQQPVHRDQRHAGPNSILGGGDGGPSGSEKPGGPASGTDVKGPRW